MQKVSFCNLWGVEQQQTPITMKTLTNILLSSHKITGNARKNIEALLQGAEIVRTCHTSGQGRFCSNIDSHAATVDGLTKLGLKFTQGNDAPKGGKTGQWVKLTEKVSIQ